jgi:hypothetical protein
MDTACPSAVGFMVTTPSFARRRRAPATRRSYASTGGALEALEALAFLDALEALEALVLAFFFDALEALAFLDALEALEALALAFFFDALEALALLMPRTYHPDRASCSSSS